MIYAGDLCPVNVALCKKILPIKNVVVADFLDKETFKCITFDIVVGNPPYNNGIWKKFVTKTFDLLTPEGFLCYIHPGSWRFPPCDSILLKKDILFLTINDDSFSKKLFENNAEIQVDYYVVRNSSSDNISTEIVSNIQRQNIVSKKTIKNIKNMKFIPNYNFDLFEKYFINWDDENNFYNKIKKYNDRNVKYSDEYSDYFKYKIIDNINSNKISYKYSDTKNESFGVKKVVLNNGRHIYPIYDDNSCGVSKNTKYIEVENKEQAEKMLDILKSDDFKNIVNFSKSSSAFVGDFLYKLIKI
jgi:hypothetical protein